jgi:hypothetical protein
MKKIIFIFFITVLLLPSISFAQGREDLKVSLESAIKWAYNKEAMKALEPYAPLLVNSKKVDFLFFPHDKKILTVNMGEGLVVPSTAKERYIGTFGLGPCIGLALIGKKNGKVVRVALAHVDAMRDIQASSPFFYRAMHGLNEVEVSLVASQGSVETTLKIIKKIFSMADESQKIEYKADLTGSSDLVINVKTGQLYKGLIFPDDFKETKEELNRILIAVQSIREEPLRFSRYQSRFTEK